MLGGPVTVYPLPSPDLTAKGEPQSLLGKIDVGICGLLGHAISAPEREGAQQ